MCSWGSGGEGCPQTRVTWPSALYLAEAWGREAQQTEAEAGMTTTLPAHLQSGPQRSGAHAFSTTKPLLRPTLLQHLQTHVKSHSKVITEISWAFKRRPFKSFHHDGVEIRLRLQSCRTFLSVLLMLTSNLSTLVVRRSRMSSCSSISVCIPRAMSFSRPRPTDSSSAG